MSNPAKVRNIIITDESTDEIDSHKPGILRCHGHHHSLFLYNHEPKTKNVMVLAQADIGPICYQWKEVLTQKNIAIY